MSKHFTDKTQRYNTMYRFIKHGCALAIASLLLVQCTQDPTNEIHVGESANNASATKIINSSRSAMAGTLLVKFSEDAALAFESGTRSGNGGVTRSNIEPLNNILLDIEAVSIERVLPVDIRHEEAARKAGLHRWYMIRFDKERALDNVAIELAKIGEINTIQFDTPIGKIDPPMVSSSSASETSSERGQSTRAEATQFNDPKFNQQWDLCNKGDKKFNSYAVAGMDCNVVDAWRYTTGDPSVIVAVIDEGVDYTHEDLAANMWVNEDEIAGDGIDNDQNGYIDDIHGVNFVKVVETGKNYGEISWHEHYPNTDGSDDHNYGDGGHGSHVAGTIAAVSNNGKGICGIAGGDGSANSGAKIMSLQIFSGRSPYSATASVISKAFYYAANNGAVLANNSWGSIPNAQMSNDTEYEKYNSLEVEAIKYFRTNARHQNLVGGLVFFATGNNGMDQVSYPGAYRDFIAVTSFGIDGENAYYSNHGPGANIGAPGGDQRMGYNAGILSTLTPGAYGNREGYDWFQGTSMACPHATGVAALGVAYAKKLGKVFTAEEFKNKYLVSVNGTASEFGTGRIDAFKLMMNLEGITTCIPIQRNKQKQLYLNEYIGDGKTEIQFIELIMSDADKQRLGVTTLRYIPTSNSFLIKCTNTGAAIVEVKMIAGGDILGTEEKQGGMTVTHKFAIIVRDSYADNGGWL